MRLLATGSSLLRRIHGLAMLCMAVAVASPAASAATGRELLLDLGSSQPVAWTLSGTSLSGASYLGAPMPSGWQITGTGDFDGNGMTDLLWQGPKGPAILWMNSPSGVISASLGAYGNIPGTPWIADFNGDGKSDILWDLSQFSLAPLLLTMNGSNVSAARFVGAAMPQGYRIAATGDFDGNGLADILWTNPAQPAPAYLWMMTSGGPSAISLAQLGNAPGKAWTGDFDGDGKTDILWDTGTGRAILWTMNGGTVTGASYFGVAMPAGWKIVGVGDFDGDGRADVVWAPVAGGPGFVWLNRGANQVSGVSLAYYGTIPGRVWSGYFSNRVAAAVSAPSPTTMPVNTNPLPQQPAPSACGSSSQETLTTASVITPAATDELANLCTSPDGTSWPAYPQEWIWNHASIVNQPVAATSGTPKVEQYARDATTNYFDATYYTDPDTTIRYRLVAVYGYLGAGDSSCDWSTPFITQAQSVGQTWNNDIAASLASAEIPYQLPHCGPFAYAHKQQSTNDGDLFLVYPAVYEGQANQPHIGESYGVGPNNNYDALVAAGNAWTAQYGAQFNAQQASFVTVPPQPTFIPITNIAIKGVTINNTRPVILAPGASDDLGQGALYIGCCSASPNIVQNLTIQNIDLVSENAPDHSMRAGVYIESANNLTLRNMRITGFESAAANGIFSSSMTAGTFTVDGVELYHDGGVPDNYAHHTYFAHSVWDANFTVHMINSWSHDSFAGHLMKSRAQNNILEGNYFQGTLPQDFTNSSGITYNVSEDYDVDIPNGGNLIARNNIFVKTLDDHGTGNGNRIELAYAMEGINVDDHRINKVDIENNTFVGLNAWWRSESNIYFSLDPMNFSYPAVVPDPVNGLVGMITESAVTQSPPPVTIPASSIVIRNNAFAGICGNSLKTGNIQDGDPASSFRGDLSVTEALSEIGQDYSPVHKYCTANTANIGAPAYSHAAQRGTVRTTSVLGAQD